MESRERPIGDSDVGVSRHRLLNNCDHSRFKKTEAKGRDSMIRKMNISPENWNVPKKKKKSRGNCRIEKYRI